MQLRRKGCIMSRKSAHKGCKIRSVCTITRCLTTYSSVRNRKEITMNKLLSSIEKLAFSTLISKALDLSFRLLKKQARVNESSVSLRSFRSCIIRSKRLLTIRGQSRFKLMTCNLNLYLAICQRIKYPRSSRSSRRVRSRVYRT